MPDHAAERLIADRYALAVPIGQGGMGVVWRARDTLLGREVAIKEVRLPPTIPDSERSSMRARVLREARAAARLNHPGAVTLYDVINEQGHAFIVMELINAPTLAQVVGKEGPLDPFRVAKIGAQVAAALAAAHQAGIVHRDVKPANVMVVADGARLTDFGIARVKGDPKLTSTGLIVGSPAYMAPEQASGAAAGPEADMWGLGATLYYGVEGRPPFERDGQIAVLTAVVNDPPRAITQAGPLAPIIEALLSKDPNRRPSASELRSQLERLAAAGPPSTAGAGPSGAAGPSAGARGGPAVGTRAATVPAEPEAAEPDAAEVASTPEPEAEPDAEPAPGGQPEAAADEQVGASPGDTEQLPELDDVPVAVSPPPPGKSFELTRPGPTRPGHGSPAHVRPDQPARPGRPSNDPPRGHPAPGSGSGTPGTAGPGSPPGAERPAKIERPGGNGHAPGTAGPGGTAGPAGTARSPGAIAAGLRTAIGSSGRRLDGGRLPLIFALLAVVALLAAAITTSVLRDNRQTGAAAPTRSGATATSRSTPTSRTPSTTKAPSPTSGQPSGAQVPPGWTTLRHPAGAYTVAYPPGWRASARTDGLNTTNVSGPAGRLFKVQSSNTPSDPKQAWTAQERTFSDRPGYQRIRLEPGRYKGLDAAVWEFTQLEGGQRVHKLDITFKSADGRWGYAVLLQSPEQAWSSTANLSGQFERAFAPSG
jgi:eukaryotic-like serine/threonine-protein kinase